MDVYEAVARDSADSYGYRLYDVYLVIDGKPHGKPVVRAVGKGSAQRIAAALTEWQPRRERRT